MTTTQNKTHLEKDLRNKRIIVTREFNAEPSDVWRAWTESDLLEQWWAPKPWRTETKKMDFRVGGHWLYAMAGPNGERHWARLDFIEILPIKHFSAKDSFCDENGKAISDLPRAEWKNTFEPSANGTKVTVQMQFGNEADLNKILEMGFEQGFAMAHDNLDHYFSTHFKLRKENKTSNKARVTSYLNFNGKTEEAFNFYKKVFRGEFSGRGLQRFEDIELPKEQPPMSEADKKLIIHAELTIFGGHILMATDAPESMGFKLQTGNNMHICVEPDSREETERLFFELSSGGKVGMPLADMFFGSYFAEFTDKYGINWMLNYQKK
jgi:PhnB protein